MELQSTYYDYGFSSYNRSATVVMGGRDSPGVSRASHNIAGAGRQR